MKIQNQTANTLVLSDVLADEISQYQSGIKQATLLPLGTTPGDSIEIPNAIAGTSVALQALLASGNARIVNTGESLGGRAVPGILAGAGGGPAFMGLVRTPRLEGAAQVFRIMFGTPVAGDQIVDLVIGGFKSGIGGGDIIVSADHATELIGTMTHANGVGTISNNLIVTFTGNGALAQAAYTIWAPLA